MAWLARRLELGPGRTVLDVGAGTGKLTRALAHDGATVVAVEPVNEMRSVLEREVPGAQVLDGRAEALPLPAGSADAIACGQAFHWFDGPRALEEFHRVLRPTGKLGLIWNRRDGAQPLQRAIDEIIERHRQGPPAHDRRQWARALDGSSRFAPGDQELFRFDQPLEPDAFVDRVMSISFVAALDAGDRDSVQERLRALAADRLEPLRHTTEIFVYSRLDYGLNIDAPA
ncbi:MAG: class I SAM-dependent methyltransferase [Solirubrobacteraceae bacterium]